MLSPALTPAPQPPQRGVGGWLRRRWHFVVIGCAGLLLGAGAFSSWITVIEHTNHTEFCITCHVMKDTVYQEYTKSSHFNNKFGVHVGCPDCHVPQYSWFDEALAKVGTVGELYAYFFEGMNKVENFEKLRAKMAEDVWAKFEATNARECRHCHDYSNMVKDEQTPSARVKHADAAVTNQNCVACHKGITHTNYATKEAAPAPDSFDVN